MKRINCCTMSIFLCFLLMVSLIAGKCSAVGAETIQENDSRLEKALLAEDWEKVADLLGSVDTETTSPVLRLIKGHACLALNRNNESLCLFLSVSTDEERKEWEKWTQDFTNKSQKSAIAYYFKADALARLEMWDNALTSFNKALELLPNHAIILNARGVSYAAMGKLDFAREDFKKATDKDPELAELCTSRGTYMLQKKTDAKIAQEWFDKALNISPGYVLALNGRGSAWTILQNWDMAVPDLKEAKMQTVGCLSEIGGVVDLNIAFMAESRNETVSKMLAQMGGINPGMSINEKLSMMDKWTPAQRQTGYDLLNNANNFNSKIQGGFGNPSKTDLGISGGIKGSLVGPQPYLEAKASGTWNWASKSQFNQSSQKDLMGAMGNRYGINNAKPINDFGAFAKQHMPGMDYGKLTKPGGVSSREIGDKSFDASNWNVFTMYGLLYKMKSPEISKIDKEK